MVVYLIKIIGEFYYVLFKSLACVRKSLLVIYLEIKIIVENILKICYIKISINDNVLTIIYFFLTFLYIGGDPVKIYFDIINFSVLNNIISAMIIKLIIVLSFIDPKIF
jgi:hypothetical protein